MRHAYILLALMLVFTPSVSAQTADYTARLERHLGPLAQGRDFSGIVGVSRGDQLLAYVRLGHSSWEDQVAFDPATRFHAGEVTGLLVHAVIQELVEDGVLDPATPIQSYLHEFDGQAELPISALLSHQSGLTGELNQEELRSLRSDDIVAWVRDHTPLTAGPHDTQPSGLNHALLVAIAERAGRGSFETLTALHVLSPAGLTSTSVSRGEVIGAAPVYQPGPAPLELVRRPTPTALPGSGGLMTSVDDMLALGRSVARREIDLFNDDGSLRPPARLARFGEEPLYVLGSGLNLIMIIPGQDLVVAYAGNIDSYPSAEILPLLATAMLDEAAAAPLARPGSTALTNQIDAAGQYLSPDLGPVRIEAGTLGMAVIIEATGERQFLSPVGEDQLLWRQFNTQLTLDKNEMGQVTGLTATRRPLTRGEERFDIPRLDLPDQAADATAPD
ncbi:serine hydrolase domain-containing protein [Maricaulis sp.]|uniref:serine hydrolase domain-containing protein n=1 Tax=Maricaulis sp. TaxID=1486257 RepID=UPI002606B93E|nr:serine hydrolase domain-containing protein [Maricaulis sp.]